MNSGLLKYPSFVTANDDGMKKKQYTGSYFGALV